MEKHQFVEQTIDTIAFAATNVHSHVNPHNIPQTVINLLETSPLEPWTSKPSRPCNWCGFLFDLCFKAGRSVYLMCFDHECPWPTWKSGGHVRTDTHDPKHNTATPFVQISWFVHGYIML